MEKVVLKFKTAFFYERGCIALCNFNSSVSLTSVYLCVVERLEWPSNCCIALKSAPPDSKCVAKAWRSACGVVWDGNPNSYLRFSTLL